MAGKNVEVEESGRALKVHTHTPHLVSLGGGRWSTAVTLHQIPHGRQSLGSTPASDIVVKGKGVEPVHCYLENERGTVVLYPLENCNVSVDGTTIGQPTQLTQGSTVCIGKNSSFRYNNPAEASVIKKSLSDSFRKKVKRSKSKSPSQDRDSSTSAEEILANIISPKVFPSNSVTVNSPASIVLGPNKFPTNLNGYIKPNDLGHIVDPERPLKSLTPPLSHPASPRTLTAPSPSFNRNPHYTTSPKAANIKQVPKNVSSPFDRQNDLNGLNKAQVDLEAEQVRLEEILNLCNDYEKQIQWERNHKPQPNRIITNGSLPRDKRLHSPTIVPSPVHAHSFTFDTVPSDLSMSGPNTPVNSPAHAFENGVLSHPGSPRTRIKTTVGNNEYISPSSSMQQTENSLDILEKKLALLNDIELICNKKPSTDTATENATHQDKCTRSGVFDATGSSHTQDTKMKNKFKFLGVQPDVATEQTQVNGKVQNNVSGNVVDSSMSRSYHGFVSNECEEMDTTDDRSIPSSSDRVYSNARNTFTKNYTHEDMAAPAREDRHCHSSTQMSQSYHGGTSPSFLEDDDNDVIIEESGKENLSSVNNIMSRSYNNNMFDKSSEFRNHKSTNKFLFNNEFLHNNTKLYANSYATLKKENGDSRNSPSSAHSAFYYSNSLDRRSTKQLNLNNKQELLEKEKQKIEGLVNELEALVKSPEKNVNHDIPNAKIPCSNSGVSLNIVNMSSLNNEHLKFILPLEDIDSALKKQRASLNGDIEELKEKRRMLLNELSEIKSNVQDIQQQEQEMSRELELEKALLEGEWKSEKDFLSKEEKRVEALNEKICECELQMDKCKQQQKDRQLHCKQSLEQQQSVLKTLQNQLTNCADQMKEDLNESITQQQELLESEKKSFEDLEFSLLEEEADWLSRREELQREISEAKHKLDERRCKLAELSSQREQIASHAVDDTTNLNAQLMCYLRKIEITRNKLREIDLQLKDISKIKGFDFTPVSTDTEEEDLKKQSQDDIDRITRVTSDAPIMEVNSNSLGRRTIASLQEIEKHRQLHLAKQGSLVIEEERKRVLELKKRVQEEVKMQWENDHKKLCEEETTCLETSDLPLEDFDKVAEHLLSSSSVSPDSMYSKSITSSSFRDQKEDRDPESRPMSDSSAYSEDQLSVRLRTSKSNVQRPLTRYLPFRGESLDLRQHIEAAGHQVELCTHLCIDSTSCRGYLNKMAGRFHHHWNKRWFVFDRNKRSLTYFADRSEKKCRGAAYFRSIEEVYVDHLNSVKSPNPHLTFVVKSADRTFFLMAPSAEAMRIWVDVIFSGAEGYQEFGHG